MSAERAAAAREKGIAQMFDLDVLYDGLVSGRLCGQPFDPKLAQLLLVLLERLDWSPDTRQLAGALPHFPEKFGINEFRGTLAALGYLSSETEMPGHLLKQASSELLIVEHQNQIWLTARRKRHLVLAEI